MFVLNNSSVRFVAFVCANIVLAEWPSNFPARTPQKTHIATQQPDVFWNNDDFQSSAQTSSPSMGKENGMAPEEDRETSEGHQLETPDLESPRSYATRPDIHEGHDSEPRVAASMLEKMKLPYLPHNSTTHLDVTLNNYPNFRLLWDKVASISRHITANDPATTLSLIHI